VEAAAAAVIPQEVAKAAVTAPAVRGASRHLLPGVTEAEADSEYDDTSGGSRLIFVCLAAAKEGNTGNRKTPSIKIMLFVRHVMLRNKA
jgi:hypothetical protein